MEKATLQQVHLKIKMANRDHTVPMVYKNVGQLEFQELLEGIEKNCRINHAKDQIITSVKQRIVKTPSYRVELIKAAELPFQGKIANWKPLPMLDNPFSEVKFPNIQSKPPLAQLEAISSCPITCYLGEETDPHLSTTSFQVVVESDKVSPQPPFLQAKQSQFPQPLLIRLLLQTLHQLRCPSLDTLQHLNVSLGVGGPKLNTVFEVRPHQCRVQGHDHFPSPAGHTISDTSQDAIGFLGHLGTLLAHIQAAVNQHPQVLLCWAAFQPLFPKPVALHGVAVAQVQDLALGFVKPHTIDLGPSIQPVQIPLYLISLLSEFAAEAVLDFLVLSAKQPQLPQPLLIRILLQTLHQLRCPSLDMLQYLNVSLVVRGPKLNTEFKGDKHFPTPAGHTIPDTSQDAVGLLGHLGTLLAHIQPAVNQYPQVLFHQAAFQPLFPKPAALHGVVMTQVQDPALSLVEPHTIDLGPSIQPVQVPLQSLPTLKQINAPAQLGVICKLTEGALDPFVQIIDKDIKQNWPQY
ncbi:hypothetical protein QYF61_017310 [Mycteria americana]|uniref:Uncharacterized protein n=1 Tax=Mycteria americana TaxID=33587 RepID=A0AAN7S3R9_MYCAM|nr:hypothetical protein QYF61_017310 [Mycteria americana]